MKNNVRIDAAFTYIWH